MPIFNRYFPQIQSVPGDDFGSNFALIGKSDRYVSATQAFHNSDIYSVLNTISGDLATSGLISDKPQIQSFLNHPSATTNGHSFWQAMYAQLLIGGEAFAYIWRNENGQMKRLEYLRPSQVDTFLQSDGNGLLYTITFDEPGLGIKEYEPQNNMIHFRLMSKTGGMLGVSPLAALRDELGIKHKSNNLTLHALDQSVSAPGILKITKGGLLDAKEKAARSKQFMAQTSGSNNGPIVLDDLEDYSTLEVKGDVSKLLSQTDWTSKQIAKVFGIPDSYLNGQGDQQSSLNMSKGMYANALNRYMTSILSELDDKISGNISTNLRLAIDATGDDFASLVGNLTTAKPLTSNQANWLLKENGYLPDNLPDQIKDPVVPIMKGGDNDDESNDSNQK